MSARWTQYHTFGQAAYRRGDVTIERRFKWDTLGGGRSKSVQSWHLFVNGEPTGKSFRKLSEAKKYADDNMEIAP